MWIYETPEESYGFRQKRNSTSMFYIITSVPFPSSRFSIIFFLFVLDLAVCAVHITYSRWNREHAIRVKTAKIFGDSRNATS